MPDDQVDVNLRFTATDETGRITQDMVRRAQEGTRAIEAAYYTRQRAIEAMAKRAGASVEEMSKRVENANKKTGISFDEMGKKMSAMVAGQLEKQKFLGQVMDKNTASAQAQAQVFDRDVAKGMSSAGKATLEASRATEKMTKGMTEAGRAARTTSEDMRKHAQATGQSTSAINSAIGSLGRYASAAYIASKAFQIATASYTGFAERQRGAFRVAEDWQLNAEAAEEYEKVQDRVFRATGQTYAQQDAAARKWGATEQSVGLERLKIWEQTQMAAHVLGISVEQAGRLGQVAIRDMGLEAKDLPKQFAGLKSVPSESVGPIIAGLEKLTPKLKESGIAGEKVGSQIVAGMAAAIPQYANATDAVSAYERVVKDALDPTTTLGRNMQGSAQQLKAGAIDIFTFMERYYKEAEKAGAYSKDPTTKKYAREFIGADEDMLKLAEVMHSKRQKMIDDHHRAELEADKRFYEAKEKLAKDAQTVADKAAAEAARTMSKTGETVHGAGASRAADIALPTTDDVVEGLRQPGFWPWNRPKPQPRARGGPVDKDKPYLTGEEGPEIIVPQTSGQVLTAAESQRYGDVLGKSQAEADMAMRNYFAQFRDKGRAGQKFAMLGDPGDSARAGRAGGGGGGGGGGDPTGGTRTGTGARGGDGTGTGDSGTPGTPGVGGVPFKTPVGLDPASETGPAENLEDAYKRGYLVRPGADPNTPLVAGKGGYVDQAALQDRLAQHIKGSKLAGYVPADGARYGIKTGSPEEWAALMKNLAGGESSFRATEHGDKGSFGGHGSRGLFQLSPQDAITYGIQKTPFTIQQLEDPEFNVKMAVKIAEKRALAGGIGDANKGMAQYWAGHGGRLNRGDYGVKPGDVRAPVIAGGGVAPGAPGTTTVAGLKTALEGGAGTATEGGGISLTGSGKRHAGLDQKLMYAALKSGLEVQVAHGLEKGHARHTENAPAYDLDLYDPVLKRKLSSKNPEDQKRIAAFIEDSVAAGAGGVGAGKGDLYMGSTRFHVGGGSDVAWGAGGAGANAPDWLKQAWARGMARRMRPEQLAIELKKLQDQRAAKAAEDKTKVAGPTAVSDVETRAAARYKAAVERQTPPPAAAPAGPSFAQRARAARAAAPKALPAPVRRIPSAPGQEERAAGKGRPAPAPVVREVSPEGSEEKAAGKGLASGGPADAGQPYMVGEQGPELFTPSAFGSVTSAGNTQAIIEAMRSQMEKPIEPVIRPRIEHLGGHSAQWQHRAERSRQADISRRAARESHTDAGFA